MRQPEPLPQDIAELLERGAVVSEPPISVRERLRSRLATALVSPVALLRPVAANSGSGLSSAFAPSRFYVGAVVGMVVGAVGMWALRGRDTAAAPAPVVTSSIPHAPTIEAPALHELAAAPAAALVPALVPARAPIAAVPAPIAAHRFVRKARIEIAAATPIVPTEAPVTSTPSSQSHWGLLAEGELLQKGRTAMVRGDTEGALAAVEEHSNRFPRGKLVEEREALRIQVLVAEDRTPEARAALGTFERDYPKSLLGPALEEAVGARIQ